MVSIQERVIVARVRQWNFKFENDLHQISITEIVLSTLKVLLELTHTLFFMYLGIDISYMDWAAIYFLLFLATDMSSVTLKRKQLWTASLHWRYVDYNQGWITDSFLVT